ncbi:MAG: hypothetical protein RL095_3176 [Verrucomicrobiota bacterium]|jgi:hypothetical protein
MSLIALTLACSAIFLTLHRRRKANVIPAFIPVLLMLGATALAVLGMQEERLQDRLGDSLRDAACAGLVKEMASPIKSAGRILFLRHPQGDRDTDSKLAHALLAAAGRDEQPELIEAGNLRSETSVTGSTLLISLAGWNPDDKTPKIPESWKILIFHGRVESPAAFFKHPGALAYLRPANVAALRAADDKVLTLEESYKRYFQLVTRESLVTESQSDIATETPEESLR